MHDTEFFVCRKRMHHAISDELYRGSARGLLFRRSIGLVLRPLHAPSLAGLTGLVCLACLHGFVVFVVLLARSGARSFFARARWDAVISAPRSGRVLGRQGSGKSRRSRVEMTFSGSVQNGKMSENCTNLTKRL